MRCHLDSCLFIFFISNSIGLESEWYVSALKLVWCIRTCFNIITSDFQSGVQITHPAGQCLAKWVNTSIPLPNFIGRTWLNWALFSVILLIHKHRRQLCTSEVRNSRCNSKSWLFPWLALNLSAQLANSKAFGEWYLYTVFFYYWKLSVCVCYVEK